ncbi:MAG TPA: cbb3-type cytochrome c oxidase subunit II, partial [Acidimicrobiia bacterium]
EETRTESEIPETPTPVAQPVPVAAEPVITQVVRAAPPVSVAELPAPLLMGRKESHGKLLAGAVALFLVGLVGSVVLPSFAVDRQGSGVVRSELAEAGREIYVTEGCGYCHTQLVRPIVTDAHLGPVTESSEMGAELPSTAGWIRMGPDLAHFADREDADPAFLTELLLNEADRPHQSYRYLSGPELEALIAYLLSLSP